MAAPTVNTLNDLISQIQAAYKPQQDIIDQSINANEQGGQSQIAGLEAKKTQAFGDISQNANDRGMYFSGYRPNEQAKYVGTTYLPALAQVQSAIANARNSLLGKKADLTVQGNNQALTVQRQQQAALDAYNQHQADLAFQAEQARLSAERTAAENEKNRRAQLTAASYSRSSSAAKEPSQAQIMQADAAAIAQKMAGLTGNDGYVSPDTYSQAKSAWAQAGYSSKTFDDYFSNFRNPQNKYYKVG